MCSMAKHLKRSQRSYKRRMAAARWYCNYNVTKEEKQAMAQLWKAMMSSGIPNAEDK